MIYSEKPPQTAAPLATAPRVTNTSVRHGQWCFVRHVSKYSPEYHSQSVALATQQPTINRTDKK